MNPPLTATQQKQLATWAEQRDAVLLQLREATIERDGTRGEAKEAGQNLAALHRDIQEVKGRIAELTALEERHKTSVSIEVAELEARKSRLEAECVAKNGELIIFDKRGNEKVEAIKNLTIVYERMSDQAQIVDQVVGKVIETSSAAVMDMKATMIEIHTLAGDVIEKGNANVAQTTIVLEKLPKYIFELQRPIPVRRTYAPGHIKHHPIAPTTP